MSLDNYGASLLFVQRIMNSNSDRLKISAPQMLFGNTLNVDRGIFVNIPGTKSAIPLSQHLDSILPLHKIWIQFITGNSLQAFAKELLRTDEMNMKERHRTFRTHRISLVLVHDCIWSTANAFVYALARSYKSDQRILNFRQALLDDW